MNNDPYYAKLLAIMEEATQNVMPHMAEDGSGAIVFPEVYDEDGMGVSPAQAALDAIWPEIEHMSEHIINAYRSRNKLLAQLKDQPIPP